MKSVMKDEGQVAVKFDLMYDQEEGLFIQENDSCQHQQKLDGHHELIY